MGNVSEKELGKELGGLMNAFMLEAKEQHGSAVEKMLQEHSHLDIKNPEYLDLILSLVHGQQKRILVGMAVEHIDTTTEAKGKVVFIYANYGFVTRHLKSIIGRYEGSCSTDKTRWLIAEYIKYVLTGDVPTITEQKYWHPNMNKVNDWFEWMDTMESLNNGDFEMYAIKKLEIIQKYGELRRDGEETAE